MYSFSWTIQILLLVECAEYEENVPIHEITIYVRRRCEFLAYISLFHETISLVLMARYLNGYDYRRN